MENTNHYREYTKVPFISDKLHQQLWGEEREDPTYTRQINIKTRLAQFKADEMPPLGAMVELPYAPWLPPVADLVKDAAGFVGWELEQAVDQLVKKKVPKPPRSTPWIPGVWRNNKTGSWQECDPPQGRLLIWDSEAVKLSGKDEPLVMMPVNACALDLEGFYWIWCNKLNPAEADYLIPCGTNYYVIHHANFDRALMSCAYEEQDKSGYLCTMAIAIATRGVPNKSIPDMKKAKRDGTVRNWAVSEACDASLAALANFHLQEPLDKGSRSRLWDEGLVYVRNNTASVNRYCLKDVETTARILPFLWREYKEQFGNDEKVGTLVTTAGNLAVSRQRLPVSDRAVTFYEDTNNLYQKALSDISNALMTLAEETHRDMRAKPASEWDPWERQLGSMICGYKNDTKKTPLYGSDLMKSGKNAGCLRWFAKARNAKKLTLHQRTAPLLLKLVKAEGPHRYPFIYQFIPDLDTEGWVYNDTSLPHPDHANQAVKDLFINGLYWHYESGSISSAHPEVVQKVLPLATSIQHYIMFRTRYQEMRIYEGADGYYFIPPMTHMGASSSNRTTCPISLVSWQATKNQIGTSFQTLVNLQDRGTDDPEVILSMDYDGQEARVGGYLSNKGQPALSSVFLLTMLVGDKQTGTDLHSQIALKLFGDVKERATGKTLFYACMYGQGESGATEYIMTTKPELTREQARDLAAGFHRELKGIKGVLPRENRRDRRGWLRQSYSGGIASEVFNSIEDFSERDVPITPLFMDKTSRPMRHTSAFKTTRDNGVIQQTGRGMLNVTMSVFDYLLSLAGIPHQIVITVHDCLKYRVPSAYQERGSFLLAIAHKITYAFLAQKLDIDTLPIAGLYPETLEIDFTWRKTPKKDCKTPETPEGLPPGRELTPSDLSELFYGPGLDGCPEFSDWWLSASTTPSVTPPRILQIS